MSFFKKFATAVFVGAAVFFTGGAALLWLAPQATIAGVAITLKGAAIYGAVYGGLQGLSMAFVKKPKMDMSAATSRLNTNIDPQALGTWVFGRTSAATNVEFSEKIDDSYVTQIIHAATHEIDGYESFYINDDLVSFSGGQPSGKYLNVVTVYRNLGTETQNALHIPSSAWPATARGAGVAHYGLRWQYDSTNGKKQLSGGIPTRITQVVRGCKVYDPRKDSTRGGSGGHRADDQSTWEWSENWALIVAHYLIGWRINDKLIYGVGKAPDEIDWPSVKASADICDQILDGKPRYRIGGAIPTTQDHADIIGQLEAAIGGKVSKFGGKYYLWVPHDDLETDIEITDEFILSTGGVRFVPSGPIENLYNSARGQYISPEALYQPVAYPDVSEPSALTEDGKVRIMDHSFSIIQDEEIAQRVSRELVRRSRFSGTLTLAVGPIGLVLKPFDVVKVNIRETNYVPELFRVIAMVYSGTGVVILELLEEDTSIYDVTAPLGPSLTQLDPNAYDPAAEIQLTGLGAENTSVIQAGGGAVDAIRVYWDLPPGFVDYTEIGYTVNGSTEYTYFRNSEADQGFIVPALPNSLYEIRARHVTISGVPGDWQTILIATGNAEFDRISFIGIDPPIEPKIYVGTDPDIPLATIRVNLKFATNEFGAIPDKFFIFYSVSDVPNQIKITTDSGDKIYLSTAIGDGVNSLFNLTVAPGSTNRVLKYIPGVADPDLYGAWWVSVRNEPGSPSLYYKVIEASENELRFAPDVEFPFVPVAGQLIDVAEVDYADGRSGEFKLAYIDGEVVRHRGIQYDGSNYYLDVAQRGAEGTTQANQSGKFVEYYPAPGPQTEIITLNAGDFVENEGVYTYSGQVILNLPSSFGWAAVTCCLAKSVEVQGKEVFIRSNIVDLVQVGPT